MAHLDITKITPKDILALAQGWPKVQCHVCSRHPAMGVYKLQNVRTGKTLFRQMCAECAFTRTGSAKISVRLVFAILPSPSMGTFDGDDEPLPHADEGGLFVATKYQTPETGEILLGPVYADSTFAAVEQAHHKWVLPEGWHLRVFRAPTAAHQEPSPEISPNG